MELVIMAPHKKNKNIPQLFCKNFKDLINKSLITFIYGSMVLVYGI